MTEMYVSPFGADKNEGTAESPLKTLSAALKRVKTAAAENWDGPVTLYLRGGIYPLEKTETVSIAAPLTVKSCDGEEAVIDGGRVLSGLKETMLNGMRCWTKKLDDEERFNTLFSCGERRQRAYLPKNGYYRIESVPGQPLDIAYNVPSDRFVAQPGTVFPKKNLKDAVIHVYHYWSDEQFPLESYDPETRLVVLTQSSHYSMHDDNRKQYAKYRIENLFEGLTEAGDWYIDGSEGVFYYLPFENETLEATVLTYPVCDKLFRFVDCADVRLENLTLRHTDWRNSLLNAGGQGAAKLDGAVSFENCTRCALVNCRMEHIGTYCVNIGKACVNIAVKECVLRDMCAGGIKIDGANANGDPKDVTHHIRIEDNMICEGGRGFLAGIGVLSMNAHHVTVSHNEIHDLYYTGISCGWVWGYAPSVSHDNIIEYNHIYDIGHGVLSDMGGIYTLGVQAGSVIRNNLVHDIEKANYGGWAIYPDEGSSHIVIENNIGYNTSSSCFHQHYGRENTVRNNIFAFGREGIVAYTRLEPHTGFTFEHNIILTDGQPVYTDPGIDCIKSDMNLFWDVSGSQPVMGNYRDKTTFHPVTDMREKGNDLFSVIDDPLFKDPAHGDFTMDEASPAFRLGFKPIDMSTVGIRK